MDDPFGVSFNAAVADNLSSDRSSPWSPRLVMYAAASGAPSISSENSVGSVSPSASVFSAPAQENCANPTVFPPGSFTYISVLP